MYILANGEKIECLKAIKGTDYIIVIDKSGRCSHSFVGISDFSGYSEIDGEWETPEPTVDMRLAQVEELVKGTPSYGELLEAVNVLLGETP